MKKSILSIGQALNKTEQKNTFGGNSRRKGECLIPDPNDPFGPPVVVGYAPCDGVSMCPGQPGYLGGLPYPPMCFA